MPLNIFQVVDLPRDYCESILQFHCIYSQEGDLGFLPLLCLVVCDPYFGVLYGKKKVEVGYYVDSDVFTAKREKGME